MKTANNLIASTALALVLAAPAWATKPQPPKPTPPPVATAPAAQHQGQEQQQVAAASAQASSSASTTQGNTQSVNTTYEDVHQAPAVFAAAGNATAACQKDRRVGLSVLVGGVSFGSSRTDRDCRLLERADVELLAGNLSASILLRCATRVYKEALGEDCVALLNTQVPIATPAHVAEYATKEELNRAFKQAAGK